MIIIDVAYKDVFAPLCTYKYPWGDETDVAAANGDDADADGDGNDEYKDVIKEWGWWRKI